jgi:peroxiredoxin
MTEKSLSEALEICTERCRSMDAPLSDRLSAFADDVRRLSPEFADVVDRMIERLKAAGSGESAPGPGDLMPPFLLPDQHGHLVGLEQLLAKGPAVVAFHRGHWCPYCTINADALARIEPKVKRLGASIAAITPEVRKFTNELASATDARFPILSDLDHAYALDVGVAIMVPDEKRAAMIAAGWDISAYVGSASWMLPIPATFVVDSDGTVKDRFVDPDYRKRMDVEDILAALRS